MMTCIPPNYTTWTYGVVTLCADVNAQLERGNSAEQVVIGAQQLLLA